MPPETGVPSQAPKDQTGLEDLSGLAPLSGVFRWPC